MTKIYFKQKHSQADTRTPYQLVRINEFGNVTVLSSARKTISTPKNFMVNSPVEFIEESEFNEELNRLKSLFQ